MKHPGLTYLHLVFAHFTMYFIRDRGGK